MSKVKWLAEGDNEACNMVTAKETCFGAVVKDAVETVVTAAKHQNMDEAAAGTRCLTVVAAERQDDDETTGRLEAAAAKREYTDEVAAEAKRFKAGVAARNMAEEAVSEARRRGENLAADEESVKVKHLVQKFAKEAVVCHNSFYGCQLSV